jgi:transcriptional regulator with XRE-family HTH domain
MLEIRAFGMVIQAELKRRRASRNKRSDVRRTMQLVAAGKTVEGKSTEVLIHDLSTGGLLVQTTVPLAVGETIEVILPRTGAREAEIVWSSGTFFGCRFLQPIPPASVSAALLKSGPLRSVHPAAPTAPLGFGERLTALRAAKGLTLEALAELLGVSRQAVWYWETGQRLPRADHFKKIAQVFKVAELELLAQQPGEITGDHASLVRELKREIARHNGVAEDKIKIVIEL